MSRRWQHYTPDDDALILRMSAEGISDATIGRELGGRGRHAIRKRRGWIMMTPAQKAECTRRLREKARREGRMRRNIPKKQRAAYVRPPQTIWHGRCPAFRPNTYRGATLESWG